MALGGNGFIAGFVAGITFGRVITPAQRDAERFSEAAGILLSIAVWTVFGATFVGSLLRDFGDPAPVIYAILSLTVVRIIPVAIALVGTGLTVPTIAFIGWFGPRGLASIVFGILAVDALVDAGGPVEMVGRTVAWTVLLSVILHGLTAGPLASRYGTWINARQAAFEATIPELEGRPEPRPNVRTAWTRRGATTVGADTAGPRPTPDPARVGQVPSAATSASARRLRTSSWIEWLSVAALTTQAATQYM